MIGYVLFRNLAAAAVIAVASVAFSEDLPTPAEKVTMDAVWNALNAEPALANHHRGFMAYLSAHPPLANALEAVLPIERHPVLRELMWAFDERLADDAELDRLFQTYCSALASDDSLRDAVDAVYRFDLDNESLQPALIPLRGDTDGAVRFLRNPAKPATPELYPLKAAFKQNPELRTDLLEALSAVNKLPAARDGVFPWWRKVAVEEDGGSAAYRRLVTALADEEQRFAAWHAAQIELARDAPARSWILYWNRRVRQQPVLADHYSFYLDIVRRRPDYSAAAIDAWEKELGPAPSWPPDAPAPTLAGPPKPRPSGLTKQDLMPKSPGRPEAGKPLPKMPDMPVAPIRPEKPGKPKPELTPPARVPNR